MYRRPPPGTYLHYNPTPSYRPYPRPRNICLHIITYGITRGRPQIPIPVIMTLDLTPMQAPPHNLCSRFTGASPEISSYYFSTPGHEAHYIRAMHTLVDVLREMNANPYAQRSASSTCLAVLINCRAGMHRSVAVAERMARDVEGNYGREGVRVVVEHLDTDVERGVRREWRARAGRHGVSRAGPGGGRHGVPHASPSWGRF